MFRLEWRCVKERSEELLPSLTSFMTWLDFQYMKLSPSEWRVSGDTLRTVLDRFKKCTKNFTLSSNQISDFPENTFCFLRSLIHHGLEWMISIWLMWRILLWRLLAFRQHCIFSPFLLSSALSDWLSGPGCSSIGRSHYFWNYWFALSLAKLFPCLQTDFHLYIPQHKRTFTVCIQTFCREKKAASVAFSYANHL